VTFEMRALRNAASVASLDIFTFWDVFGYTLFSLFSDMYVSC
jgi:hypothetical protein